MKPAALSCCVILALLGPGCSFKKLAVNKVGDALAAGGTTFASDDDPELIKAAVPFSLKLMESLLAESPRHEGLLSATASGFTQYSYAFVTQEADELEAKDYAASKELKFRARRLYLRARDYGLRGLEVRHRGFAKLVREKPLEAVRLTRKNDVALLYWTAASWAGAISFAKDDPDLVADVPAVEAMMDRALQLDEKFGDGAIHSFLIMYEINRQGATGDPIARATRHFERAMELSGGHQASPLVSYAEAVSVQRQDHKEFESLLNRALAIDVNTRPEFRLENMIMQRRAKWLLSRSDELFLKKDDATN